MICEGCKMSQHEACYDVLHSTDYRSCTCLHRVVASTITVHVREAEAEGENEGEGG